jgi:Flp pilus assembly protein TadB
MLDSREPPNGDFVAFVEKIEREQLARAMQPHKLPHLTASGSDATNASADGKSRSVAAAEAQRLLQALKGRRAAVAARPAPLGAMVGVVIGALLVAFGLIAEGGIILVLVGAALLWHSVRKLRRRAGQADGSPGQQVEQTFGHHGSGAKR